MTEPPPVPEELEVPRLPLGRAALERILPHRHPFLLVDRITELEPGRRVVGIKNVTRDECLLVRGSGDLRALSPLILMETVAQVGAVLVLLTPQGWGQLAVFMGIQRARFRRKVEVGDVVRIEARVRRLGPRIGSLEGRATVGGRRVAEGVVTFAFGPPPPGPR